MKRLTKTGILFYCVAIAATGVHQLFYGAFCLILFPKWPVHIPGIFILADLGSLALIGACVAIVIGKNARTVSLILGGILLLLIFLVQVPYEFIIIPYKKSHLGLWVLPLKELAYAGGAFCIAGALPVEGEQSRLIRLLEKLIPYGGLFFSITMVSFGISHFLYQKTVIDMVPDWIPDHISWAYFAGIALIASGVAIILKIRVKPIATLLGVMIFLWFVLLHAPDAINNPLVAQGNEITAALSALAFSGIAFVIAGDSQKDNLL